MRVVVYFVLAIFSFVACESGREKNVRKIDYQRVIPGVSDSVSSALARRGEVLISYSDCYTCHKEDRKLVGPSFRDIAKRYPRNKVYINMLAQRVIIGGSGSWGTPVMDPHPDLPLEDAKAMVTYIMSMKE